MSEREIAVRLRDAITPTAGPSGEIAVGFDAGAIADAWITERRKHFKSTISHRDIELLIGAVLDFVTKERIKMLVEARDSICRYCRQGERIFEWENGDGFHFGRHHCPADEIYKLIAREEGI